MREIVVQPPMPDPALPSACHSVRADLPALAERLRPALWRYARVLGADSATADDLAQEAFLVVLRRPDFDASEPGAVFTFLRTTVRHLWLRSRRRRVSEQEVSDGDALWTARCGEDLGGPYVDALRACIEQLPVRSRGLLAATYGEGAGRAAAGEPFGLGREGVKSALRRLRTLLHACITRRLAGTR